MINNFEIRRKYNEEVLYIFINDDYEFTNINKGKKRKSFLKQVSNFIKTNNIKFAGTTICLVAGGLIIGNLFLNRSDDLNLKNCIVSLNINPQVEISEVVSDDFFETTSLNTKITIDENANNYNEKRETEKPNTNSIIKDNVINKEVKEEKIKEADLKESVTVFRNNGEILNLELENYLVNVVASEMPASFNIEALKAQSVLARTYAKKAVESGKVLTDTTSTQTYKDNNELKNIWGKDYKKYYEKIKNAVMSTAGEVLKFNGDYIEAVYHSTSNGFTEDSLNVWGNSFPYLKIVESTFDKNVKNFQVNNLFSYDNLSNLLGFSVDNSTEFNIVERNNSNRVSKLFVNNHEFTGIKFRELLALRSTDFVFEKVDNGLNIITRGYGHGVGMSQYGANEMAKNGANYREILNYYYSSTSLVIE